MPSASDRAPILDWRRAVAWLPLVSYSVAIVLLADYSRFSIRVPAWNDKILHFCGYFVYGLVAELAIRAGTRRWPLWFAIVISGMFGMIDEFHQSAIASRTADVRDWLADMVGAGLASLLVFTILRGRRF